MIETNTIVKIKPFSFKCGRSARNWSLNVGGFSGTSSSRDAKIGTIGSEPHFFHGQKKIEMTAITA